jgi:drug/metabolite transporter (DMT)-like permease
MKSVTKKIYLIDFSLAVLGYILFVVFDSLNKKLTGSYHVSQIIFINTIFALIPIFLFTQKKKAWHKLKRVNLKVQFFRAGFMFLGMLAFIMSSEYLTLIIMYSVVFTTPLLTTIGASLFLREKVGWRRYAAITMGFIGVVVSLDPFNETLSKYIFLVFLTPLFISINWLIIRKFGQTENIYSFLVYGKFFILIFAVIFLFNHFVFMNLNDFLLNALGGIVRGVALIFIINAARHLPSSLFAPTQYIQVFAAGVLGFFIFGDIPTLNNLFGNTLIISACAYIIIRELATSKKIVTTVIKPTVITPYNKD